MIPVYDSSFTCEKKNHSSSLSIPLCCADSRPLLWLGESSLAGEFRGLHALARIPCAPCGGRWSLHLVVPAVEAAGAPSEKLKVRCWITWKAWIGGPQGSVPL